MITLYRNVFIAFCATIIFAACSQSHHSSFWNTLPDPVGVVNDFENIYTSVEETSLDSLIKSMQSQADVEIAIVTLDTLSTSSNKFDDLTLHIAKTWGVGEKGKNNGILIGISNGYRKIRIQNGLGIEKRMSDAETKNIIDQFFIPPFKKGDYYHGTVNGLNAIFTLLKKRV